MATSPLLVTNAQGQPVIEPSVSSRWTFDQSTATRYVSQRDVILLSWMEGGPSNALGLFIDYDTLRTTYDPENLGILGVDLASYLKTPSNDLNQRGAYRVYVARLGDPTGASLTLLDAGAQPVLLLASTDRGSYTNKISVEVASGSVAGKRVTVRFRQETTVLDNLQNALHLAYTGNATAATLTLTRTADVTTRLQTALTGATDGSINLDLDLTQPTFSTVQQLATYLNGQNGYRAIPDPYGAPLLPTRELDGAAAVNIRTPTALIIRYVGAGSACTMTVTNTTLTTTVTGGPGGQNLNVTFSAAATDILSELVAYINSFTGVYTCTLGPNADPNATPLSLLTNVTNQDIRTANFSLTAEAGQMAYVLPAALGTIIYAITTRVPRLSATRSTNAVNAPANRAQTFLAGGTNPVPTFQDWYDALTLINQEDMTGAMVFPVTTDPVIQDAINAWASEQYTNSGKHFRPFLAPPDFTSAADAKSLALGWNSTYAQTISQPVVSASGVTEQPPLYPVAMYCGAAAGSLPTQSLTRLVLRCRSLPARAKYDKPTREDLLSNGVAALEEVKGVGVRIALAVTTSLSQDRIFRILSESMARDDIEARIRAYVEPLIPHWAMMNFMPTVKGVVWDALASLEADGIITKGIDAQGRILPAWQPIQVSIQGGVMKIVVHVLIGGEINHILIFGTIGYQQFELTIDAGA